MLLRLLAPWFVLLLPVPSLSAQSSPAPPPVRWSGYIQARETYQHGGAVQRGCSERHLERRFIAPGRRARHLAVDPLRGDRSQRRPLFRRQHQVWDRRQRRVALGDAARGVSGAATGRGRRRRPGVVRARRGAGHALAPPPGQVRAVRARRRGRRAAEGLDRRRQPAPLGRATRFTLEYVSRTSGDPRTTRGLGLAQVQVLF